MGNHEKLTQNDLRKQNNTTTENDLITTPQQTSDTNWNPNWTKTNTEHERNNHLKDKMQLPYNYVRKLAGDPKS